MQKRCVGGLYIKLNLFKHMIGASKVIKLNSETARSFVPTADT